MKKYLFIAAVAFLIPSVSKAAVTITAVSLSQGSVVSGSNVTLNITANQTGSACDNNWITTAVWLNGNPTNLNFPNLYTGTGMISTSTQIAINAPAGTYDLLVQSMRGSEPGLSCPNTVNSEATTTIIVTDPAPVGSTQIAGPNIGTVGGGYMSPCYYIKSFQPGTCADSPELTQAFTFNQVLHDLIIGAWYATWRVSF